MKNPFFYSVDAPKGQYVFVYPNAPQLPLLALRQDGGTDILTSFNNWWTDFSQNFGQGKKTKFSFKIIDFFFQIPF